MDEVIKRRAIGAAVLVALGLLLPFLVIKLLRSGAPPAGESVRVYEITPGGQARPVGRREAAATRKADVGRRQSAPAQPDGGEGKPLAETAAAQQQTGAGGESPEGHDQPLADAISEPESEHRAAEPPAVESDKAAQAVPPREPMPKPERNVTPAAQSAAAGTHWVVQVGSFVQEDNAIGLMQRLAADYPAFYRESKVSGRMHYRVRVGPYDNTEQAEQVADKLRALGRNAQVLRAD